jgi:hypothetical protein
MTKPHNIASFVLRFTQELWQDLQGEAHIRWRGHIRHVQSDAENRFTDFAEAVTFMQRYLTQLTLDTLTGEESMNHQRAFQESFKLWEQFAASYTDLMLRAMERTIEQSEALKTQMSEATEKTLAAWQLAPAPAKEMDQQILAALTGLQDQMKKLSERVERLEKNLEKSRGKDHDNDNQS